MNADGYLSGPDWSILEPATVLGRPVQVWKERPRHILDLLDLAPDRDDLAFLVAGEQRYTFVEFKAAIERAAEAFAELGVQRGEAVLIVLYNCPEMLLAQWGLFRLGAVPVFGNRWWSEAELAEVIERIRPALIVTDMRAAGAPVIGPSAMTGWWSRPAPARTLADPRNDGNEDDVAMIVFTAGSTGAPKGVQQSHRVVVWSLQTIHVMSGGRPQLAESPAEQKVILMTTPMFHNGAIVTGIAALIDGSRLVLLRGRFDAAEVLRLIEAERVTNWQAVPTMFSRFLQHPDFAKHDLSSFVAPATGGTFVPGALLEAVKRQLPHATARFTVGYGMTEGSFLTMSTLAVMDATRGSVGKPIPGAEVKIDQPDATGQGELLGRSGGIMIGYFGAEQQPIDADGWYHTGDLGRIDDEGYVYVTGRVKDMIIRGGENIACNHVEDALLEHPDVLEASVVGYPDAEFGEAVGAFVRLREDSTLEQSELATFARSKLAYFCVPSRWRFVRDPLPVLATGKVDKLTLAKQIATPDEQANA